MAITMTEEQERALCKELGVNGRVVRWIDMTEQEIFEALHTPVDVSKFDAERSGVEVKVKRMNPSPARDRLTQFLAVAQDVMRAFSILTPQRTKWSTLYLRYVLHQSRLQNEHYSHRSRLLESHASDPDLFLSQQPGGALMIEQLYRDGGREYYAGNASRTQRAIDDIVAILAAR